MEKRTWNLILGGLRALQTGMPRYAPRKLETGADQAGLCCVGAAEGQRGSEKGSKNPTKWTVGFPGPGAPRGPARRNKVPRDKVRAGISPAEINRPRYAPGAKKRLAIMLTA